MSDMTATILPKSDQLSADDLIGGKTLTIKILDVAISPGKEQPVTVSYDNDGGRPYRPCKSMRRVMVYAWGDDAKQYIGRSMTLYRDPAVKYAGLAVGGIRISHMSHIDKQIVVALSETKGNKKPFVVKPLGRLVENQEKAAQSTEEKSAAKSAKLVCDDLCTRIRACVTQSDLDSVLGEKIVKDQREWMLEKRTDLNDLVDEAISEVVDRLVAQSVKL